MAMYLSELLSNYKTVAKIPKIFIKNIAYSINDITEEPTAFFHLEAFLENHNWQQRIEEAIKKGAVVLVLDASDPFYDYKEITEMFASIINIVTVIALHKNISFIATKFFNYPDKKMRVLAVTGTNGKTSVAHITAQALNNLGISTAIVGSVGYGLISESLTMEPLTGFRLGYTTPPAISLFRILDRFVHLKVEIVVIEVTSHALEWDTIAAIDIEVAIFTNVTADHLEYHGNMLSYINAKKKLFNFSNIQSPSFSVINSDDRIGRTLIRELSALGKKIITYSSNQSSNYGNAKVVLAQNIMHSINGTSLDIYHNNKVAKYVTPFLGSFCVHNILAVASCLITMGFALNDVALAFSKLVRVPGRMEVFSRDGLPTSIVDFAHNPDGIEKCLSSAREISSGGKLYFVYGCSDVTTDHFNKMVADIVNKYADYIIITSTNAYSTNTQSIEKFVEYFPTDNYRRISNRKKAIRYAINKAHPGDIVLIVGKGVQNFILTGGKMIPHNDVDYIKNIYVR